VTVLYGGLIVWLATLIIVESFIFQPLRDWLETRYWLKRSTGRRTAPYWQKLAYLIRCQLCMGTWVGWVVAAFIPGPLPLFWTGLLYKAVAHCILEVTGLLRRTNP